MIANTLRFPLSVIRVFGDEWHRATSAESAVAAAIQTGDRRAPERLCHCLSDGLDLYDC